jgi:hypothetical protein
LKINLISLSYYICLILELTLAIAIAINFKTFKNLFKGITRKQWCALIIVFFVALMVRAELVPHRHYVFFDEYEHFATAKNLFENKSFSRPEFYLSGKVYSAYLPQWLPGYHFLLSQFFNFFGVKESTAFNMNVVFSSLSILLLFLGCYLISASSMEAFIAACLLAFLPLHMKFAGNSSLETLSLFFCLLTFLSCMIFLRIKSHSSLFLVIASLAFTLMIRAENIIWLPLVLLFFIVNRIPFLKFWKLLPLIVLFIPSFLYIPNIRAYMLEQWIQPRSSLAGVRLFMHGLSFWVQDTAVPFLLVIFALGGFVKSFINRNKIQAWLACCFIALLAAFAFVEKLDLFVGESQRFNVMLCFPLIILAASGMIFFIQNIRQNLRSRPTLFFLTVILLAVNYFLCFPYVHTEISNPILSSQYQLYLRGASISEKCVFVAYNPSSIIATIQRPVVHISYLFNEPVYDKYLKDKCLVLTRDYWCDKDPLGFYKRFSERYSFERISLPDHDSMSLFYLIKNKN